MTAALRKTVDANQMETGVHIRLMVTRGPKKAPNHDPRNALGTPTIVIVAEHKEPSEEIVTRGLKLMTSSVRCTPKEMFDMRLNSHSRLGLIRAFLDVMDKGADEALMLDPHGFVSSCNATNFFWVKEGAVRTSNGDYCFNGVTRANVIGLCRGNDLPIRLGSYPLEDAQAADEAFVTGTFGGLTPVREIDGCTLPEALPGPVTSKLRGLYAALKDADAARAHG
jgi:branched-chain amino acid aminotransferase